TLSLLMGKSGDKKAAIKSGDKKAAAKTVAHKQAIIFYLTENVSAKSSEIAELLGLKPSRAKEILAEMVVEDILVPEGSNKNRVYKLKA
ncbi:MAG: AAA family ATPase, partial [Clostridia bacterium]|nr:AAA family ATPase [Clostridia bacterium]